MTSTKIFSAKKTSILVVVAVFTLAFTIGMGPISSSMALTNSINCNTEGDDDASDGQTSTVTTCHKEVSKGADDSDDNTSVAASDDDDEDNDEFDNQGGDNLDLIKSNPQNIASNAPAVASPPDNIIKPINLNKGFTSDKPLKTDNVNHVTSNGNNNNIDDDGGQNKIQSKKVIEDEMPLSFNNKLEKSSSVSELYESFNLPYTALYN